MRSPLSCSLYETRRRPNNIKIILEFNAKMTKLQPSLNCFAADYMTKQSKIKVENNEYSHSQLLPIPVLHFFNLNTHSYLIKLQVTIFDTSISIGPEMIFYL